MSAVMLPDDLQAWAEAEVAAGRAQSVEQVVALALRAYHHTLESFRRSLDDAAAGVRAGEGVELDEAFDIVEARLEARAAFEEQWPKRAKRA